MIVLDRFTEDYDSIDFESGAVFLVDKPLEWSSFDVVNKLRYRLSKRLQRKRFKVGHNGTLDPLATGLLMIFAGKYTKLIPTLENETKRYRATIKLGATTTSLDREMPEEDLKPFDHIDRSMLDRVITNFLGEQLQEIPIFSAAKVDGRRMYKLARKDAAVKPKVRTVTFHTLDVLDFDPPFVKIDILCGKGTYIRSFARDLGAALHTSGYLYALERTAIGEYELSRAMDVQECCERIFRLK